MGEKPNTVRVYRRNGRKNIYIRTWNPERGAWDKRSLGHDDVEKAKAQAAKLHAKLLAGEKAREGKVTLARLFTLYGRHETPTKGEQAQGTDRRRAELWTRILGADKDPMEITTEEWETFKARRRSGEIDARGRPVQDGERRPVGDRALEADCRWLKSVGRWAVSEYRTEDGHLLDANPLEGEAFPVPVEDNSGGRPPPRSGTGRRSPWRTRSTRSCPHC